MFCRFCGASITPESQFCSRCGKRLRSFSSPGQRLLRTLRLDTPYPWAGILMVLFVAWLVQPHQAGVDYSRVRFALELEAESGRPEENLFRHHLSLIEENVSADPIRDVPIEFRVRVDSSHPGEVLSDFLGQRLLIHRNGESLPLVVVLADPLEASEKRRYSIDGIVTMEPPADFVYEVLAEGTGEILASLPASIRLDATSGDSGEARLRSAR